MGIIAPCPSMEPSRKGKKTNGSLAHWLHRLKILPTFFSLDFLPFPSPFAAFSSTFLLFLPSRLAPSLSRRIKGDCTVYRNAMASKKRCGLHCERCISNVKSVSQEKRMETLMFFDVERTQIARARQEGSEERYRAKVSHFHWHYLRNKRGCSI